MPGANEVLGCPQVTRNFLSPLRLKQLSDDPFLAISGIFSSIYDGLFCSHLRKTFFHFISISLLFLNKLLSDSSIVLDSRGRSPSFFLFLSFYPYFFNIYTHFIRKTPFLNAPRLDTRGRRTPAPPSARHCSLPQFRWPFSLRESRLSFNECLCL